MAVVVIGGLLTSTVLTLVVVPVVYSIFEGIKDRFRKWFGRKAPPPAARVVEIEAD
jgi:HAE1 family hydrophobic/amphiphilic exporter-1